MLKAVHIARYRGIRDLVVDEIGRVNLIIGKNDSGKTAFLEALRIAEDPEHAANLLLQTQKDRLGRARVNMFDFDRFWRPLFPDLNAKVGISISASDREGSWNTLEVRQGALPNEVITDRDIVNISNGTGEHDETLGHRSWSLDLEYTREGQVRSRQQISATQTALRMPAPSGRPRSAWIASAAGVGATEVAYVSELKQRGQDGALLDLLHEVDDRVAGIELLAPGGDVPELFVRAGKGAPLLPLSSMGEGFQRCLELGAAAAVHDGPTMFIDEIENGMHHLVLHPLWKWIAAISRTRGLQVFATTHSDECIQSACQAFADLDDDGLRVIRLDRMDTGTRASIYERTLIETAERTGTEIRG